MRFMNNRDGVPLFDYSGIKNNPDVVYHTRFVSGTMNPINEHIINSKGCHDALDNVIFEYTHKARWIE